MDVWVHKPLNISIRILDCLGNKKHRLYAWSVGTTYSPMTCLKYQCILKIPISKKHFRLGGLPASEWTRSVRAARDTRLAYYSAPGVNTTREVTYRPPIAVSPCLLALSVSYFKQTLWRCGQLRPYVGMGSLCTHSHRDCNASGSTQSRKERVRPKVGKHRVCIFIVWQDEMKMRSCLSIYPGVSRIYTPRRSFHLRYLCVSVHPPWLLNDILEGRHRAKLEIHLEAEVEWTGRRALRPWSIEFGDALEGRVWVTPEMHFEAVLERVWGCNLRLRSSELRAALGGRDWLSLEMHLEAVIDWVWICTGRPRSRELRDTLGGCDWSSLEMHWEA